MGLRRTIFPYTYAFEKGLEDENWYLLLMAACILPDLCTSIEGKYDRVAYIQWFVNYVDRFKVTVKGQKKAQLHNLI